jgi:hypothetical protein
LGRFDSQRIETVCFSFSAAGLPFSKEEGNPILFKEIDAGFQDQLIIAKDPIKIQYFLTGITGFTLFTSGGRRLY